MSGIGPSLPPHLLAKRKRKEEDAAQYAPTTASGANRSPSPSEADKRRRVIGPAMPPAPLDERPTQPANNAEDSDSDDDDDFGPSMPPTTSDKTSTNLSNDTDDTPAHPTSPPPPERLKRDEWMTMPPTQDDLAARMDPTNIRARGFNTGKGAKAPNAGGGGDSSAWHETPEQKQKRLQEEMLGTAKPSNSPNSQNAGRSVKEEAQARRIREKVEKTRGPSLMDQHTKRTDTEPEDDPSTRAFDREKDMGSGMRIGSTQRKEMLSKAAGFSSKFSGGSYL